MSKIPLVNKGTVDDFLIESSEKIENFNNKRNNKSFQRLITNSMRGINPFVEFLEQISKIYNEPIEVLIDNKNLYLIEGKKQRKIGLNLKGYDIKMILNNKYNIITLCGSVKFKDEFMKVQEKLTLEGNIVLTPNFLII